MTLKTVKNARNYVQKELKYMLLCFIKMINNLKCIYIIYKS